MTLWLHALLLAGMVRSSAQIQVGPGGSGVLTFDTLPTVAQGWSTLSLGITGANFYSTATNLDAALQNVVAGSINQALGTSPDVPPGLAALARWNNTLLRIQTRPSADDCTLLMATLRNNVGNLVGSVTFSAALAVEPGIVPNEEISAHRALYSLTGLAGSWQLIPEFSGVSTSGVVTATLNVEWPTNSLLYLLWGDDNAVVTDGAYTIDNFSVTTTVSTNIVITSQPEPAAVPPGSPASFEVVASGAQPLRYQWRKDEVPLAEATNAVFSIAATMPADLGSYSVVVSNAYDTILSSNTTLTFGTNPVQITLQPTGFVARPGSPGTFWVQVSGSTPAFQWFKNGSAISTATNASFSIPSVIDEDAGLYFVQVSNQLNSVTSSIVPLHVRHELVLLVATNAWRYDASGTQPPSNWRERDFDDAAWPSGPAVLGFDNSPLVAGMIKTTLPLTNANGATIISYRFRARFTNVFEGLALLSSNLIDDGAVFYLNGVEILRQNMPVGTSVLDWMRFSIRRRAQRRRAVS